MVAGKERKVLCLIKALYGLRQAPRAWYAKLDASLASLGFQRSTSEHVVYTHGKNSHRLIVGVYVDDLVITCEDIVELRQFKEEMKKTFQMSDLGHLRYYLGLEVNQTTGGIIISQGTYTMKILEAAGLANCNPSVTPMESRLKLSKFSVDSAVDTTEYRRIVGTLRYLVKHKARFGVCGGLHLTIYGETYHQALRCRQVHTKICRRDGELWMPLPQKGRKNYSPRLQRQ